MYYYTYSGSYFFYTSAGGKAHTKYPQIAHLHQPKIRNGCPKFLSVIQEKGDWKFQKAITCVVLSVIKSLFLSYFCLFCTQKKIYCDTNTFLGLFLVWTQVMTHSLESYWFWKEMHRHGDFNLFFSQSVWCAFDWLSVWVITARSRSAYTDASVQGKSSVCFLVVVA